MTEYSNDVQEIVAFVLERADDDELDTIVDVVRRRRTMLVEIAAANVKVGARVRMQHMKPKYFNGLTGVVTDVRPAGTHRSCTVRLDAASVAVLAMSSRRYAALKGLDSFELTGIPAGGLRVITD